MKYQEMNAGEPITQSQLDRTCEDYLKTNFKEAVDFALENSLPLLLEDGLISKDAQVPSSFLVKQSQEFNFLQFCSILLPRESHSSSLTAQGVP